MTAVERQHHPSAETSFAISLESFAERLSDWALEVLTIRTQAHRVRFATLPGVWLVANGDHTWRALPLDRRPVGSLGAFVVELIELYTGVGRLDTAESLGVYLAADRRDAILRAIETPTVELIDSPVFCRHPDDVLPPWISK
jgi:hypothetical protein